MTRPTASNALLAWIFLVVQLSGLVRGEDLQFSRHCGKTVEYDSKFRLYFADVVPRGTACDVTLTARGGRNIVVYFVAVPHSREACAEITLHDYTQTDSTYQGELGRYVVKWNKRDTIAVCNNFLPSTAYRSISNTLLISLKTTAYTEDHGFALQVEEDSGSILPQLYFCHSTITFSGTIHVASFPWRKVEGAKRCVTRFQARNKKHISVIFKELYIDGTIAGQCSFNGLLISDGRALEGPYLGGGYMCGDHIPADTVSRQNNITLQLNFDQKTSLYPRRYYLAILQETGDDGTETLVPLNAVIGTGVAILAGCCALVAIAYACHRRRLRRYEEETKEGRDTDSSTATTSEEHSDAIPDKTMMKEPCIESHVGNSPERQMSEQPLLQPSAPPVEDLGDWNLLPCGHPDHYAPGFPKPPPYRSSERINENV